MTFTIFTHVLLARASLVNKLVLMGTQKCSPVTGSAGHDWEQ